MIERASMQREIFNGLLGTSPAETIGRFMTTLALLTPQRLFAAVVARAELDGVVDVAPLVDARLQELAARLFDTENGVLRLRESAGNRSIELLKTKFPEMVQEIPGMIHTVLQSFLKDFGSAWLKDQRVSAEKVMSLPLMNQPVL